MSISGPHLRYVTWKLDVYFDEDREVVAEQCFNASYAACMKQDWKTISKSKYVGDLRDPEGQTLFSKALTENK